MLTPNIFIYIYVCNDLISNDCVFIQPFKFPIKWSFYVLDMVKVAFIFETWINAAVQCSQVQFLTITALEDLYDGALGTLLGKK